MDQLRAGVRRVIVNVRSHMMITLAILFVILSAIVLIILYENMNGISADEQNATLLTEPDEVPLIYGHNDLAYSLYTFERNRINAFDLNRDLTTDPKWSNSSHTDIPRLLKSKVGAQFWVAYVPCDTQYKDAVERTLEQIDVIKRMVAKYPQYMKYTTSADGIMQAFKKKKIGSLIAVEGGHSMDSRLAVLRMYYELGVRYMTLTHTCNTPWADASPVDADTTPVRKNISAWGRNVISEMNRLGMLIDISHVSHGVMLNVLEETKAPVIFSHSSSHHVFPHHRNVQDDVLRMLYDNDGIIMVKFDTEFTGGNTIDKFVEHLNDIKYFMGTEHIGLGGDYHGVDSTPQGSEGVSKYPDLFEILANGTYNNGTKFKAWTQVDLQNLAGRNILRVFREVEQVRDRLTNIRPYEDLIPYQDFVDAGVADQPCMSDMDIHKNLRGQ